MAEKTLNSKFVGSIKTNLNGHYHFMFQATPSHSELGFYTIKMGRSGSRSGFLYNKNGSEWVLLNISREGEIFVKTGFFLLLLLVLQCAKISNSCGKLQIRALITWDHER